MSAVFREIAVEFGGKEYTFTPSNKLLRKIDAGLSPNTLLGVVSTMSGEQLPLYDIAFIVSKFIEAGGGSVDEEQVLQSFMPTCRKTTVKGSGQWSRPLLTSFPHRTR